jgi:hypothetical protein
MVKLNVRSGLVRSVKTCPFPNDEYCVLAALIGNKIVINKLSIPAQGSETKVMNFSGLTLSLENDNILCFSWKVVDTTCFIVGGTEKGFLVIWEILQSEITVQGKFRIIE